MVSLLVVGWNPVCGGAGFDGQLIGCRLESYALFTFIGKTIKISYIIIFQDGYNQVN